MKYTLLKDVPVIFPPEAVLVREDTPVKSGDYVKICAGCENGARESFWVQIKNIDVRTVPVTWRAQVANDLRYTALHGLKDGDWINVPRDCMVAIIRS